jgi:antitoxin MazE
MTIALESLGTSLAVRIPQSITEELHLEKGATLRIIRKNNTIVLEPTNAVLEEMLARISPENLHIETEWGEAIGVSMGDWAVTSSTNTF